MERFKRRQTDWQGYCPINQSKTNNNCFAYNDDGRFHCFSCNAKGRGAIDLTKLVKNIGFQAAVEFLSAVPPPPKEKEPVEAPIASGGVLPPLAKDTWRKFVNLRYRLIPYIYSTSWQVTSNGYTMMRPLVMDFPNDPKVLSIGDQFFFGPDLMVNPVELDHTPALDDHHALLAVVRVERNGGTRWDDRHPIEHLLRPDLAGDKRDRLGAAAPVGGGQLGRAQDGALDRGVGVAGRLAGGIGCRHVSILSLYPSPSCRDYAR